MIRAHRLSIYHSLSDIQRSDWERIEDPQSPFADYDFLIALEKSGCMGKSRGQMPYILTLWNEQELDAALIVYLKGHSYGEYIFDWAWANASEQAGIAYYPKLVSYTPFTPSSCQKILLVSSLDSDSKELLCRRFVSEVKVLLQSLNASSMHFLFTEEQQQKILANENFIDRHSFQYHWQNKNYQDFEDFLSSFKSRKAKQVRRERREVSNLDFRWQTGETLTPGDAEDFYQRYLSTIENKGAMAYLNQDFFELVFTTMGERVCVASAYDGDECVGRALFFTKGSNLFGRYWGPGRDIPFLHFELCYYQGIDFALRNHLKLFEAGAQGEHKIARGFVPSLTRSAHLIVHPGLESAVRKFCEDEKVNIKETFKHLATFSPFHSKDAPCE